MLQEPLVQNNILATILRNFNFYLFGSDWLPYALGVLILKLNSTYSQTCQSRKRKLSISRQLLPFSSSKSERTVLLPALLRHICF